MSQPTVFTQRPKPPKSPDDTATGVLLVPIADLARDVQRYFNHQLTYQGISVTVHSTSLDTTEADNPKLAIEISKVHK